MACLSGSTFGKRRASVQSVNWSGGTIFREVEKNQILRALAYCRGRQGRAAEIRGISRKTLWEKRQRYGIP